MKRLSCHFALLALAFAQCAFARDLAIDETDVDFGEKYQFAHVVHDIQIWNHSGKPIAIKQVKRISGLGSATVKDDSVPAGGSTMLHVDLPLGQSLGLTSSRFMVEASEPDGPQRYVVRIRGFVRSVVDDPNPVIDLGTIDQTKATIVEKKVTLASSDFPSLRIVKIIEAPAFVTARQTDAATIMLRSTGVASLGINTGMVKVALSTPEQSEAWIQVDANLLGDVVPDLNPLDFGLQRVGQRSAQRLQLTSRSGKEFKLGTYSVSGAKVAVEPVACLPKPVPDCRAFMLTVERDQPIGQIYGKIYFPLPDKKETLAVDFSGLLLSDSTRVKPIEEFGNNSEKSSNGGIPLEKQLKESVVDATRSVTPPGTGPVLKWEVANEAAIFGYAIYRGETADGHFSRINDQIVKAQNGGDGTNASYQWRDTSAVAGHEYWYYIVMFHNNGRKEPLSGPQKVVAK